MTAFHPTQNILAAGLVNGEIQCFRYANEGNITLHSIRPHKKSCRALEFNHDGTVLFSASKDKSLQAIDVATGTVLIKKTAAHGDAINSMLRLNETTLVTGDDIGCIKAWDIRTGQETIEYNENEDYISDMTYYEPQKTLLATSAGGHLSIFDIRKSKPMAVSEDQDDQLLSVVVVKNGRKVAVGTQEGIINIFNWGAWGDCTDRFVGHPNSIETMVRMSEDVIVTGSMDGMIRVCGIHPNDLLGVVGEHEDFPIERLGLSYDEAFLSSCSHDNTVRFWNMAHVLSGEDEEGDANDGDAMDVDSDEEMEKKEAKKRGGKKKVKGKGKAGNGNAGGFFADL